MIEVIPIENLIPDPANARKHSKKNLDAIKGSLARFGQQKPIVVSKDLVVIAGNGTLEAARQLNWKTLQVIKSELTGSDITAYGISDNRTSELAEWDDEALNKVLEGLKLENFDLGSIGFDDKDLERLFPKFDAGSIDDQGKLDEKKKIICPECGHEFKN